MRDRPKKSSISVILRKLLHDSEYLKMDSHIYFFLPKNTNCKYMLLQIDDVKCLQFMFQIKIILFHHYVTEYILIQSYQFNSIQLTTQRELETN